MPVGQGNGTPVLYALRATISWNMDGAARAVTLHSERLGSLPAHAPMSGAITWRGRGQAGFTLLEIMVALVVFGFLLAGLIQGVQFGLRAWNGQTALIAQRGDLDAVDTTLRGLIESMDPGSATEAPNIVGLPHAVAFTTTLPAGAADADDRHADISPQR